MVIKKLFAFLILVSALAFGQAGPYPPSSVIWANIPVQNGITALSLSNWNLYNRPLPQAYNLNGQWVATFSNITGAPATCQILFVVGTQSAYLGGVTTTGTIGVVAQNFLTLSGRIQPSTIFNYGGFNAVSFGWSCGTFPTGGSMTIEYIPDPPYATGYLYSHINANTTTVVRANSALLHTFSINTPGSAETITIFDNTACSGTVIAVITTPATVGQTLTYDLLTQTGICVTTAGTTAGDYTVTFR